MDLSMTDGVCKFKERVNGVLLHENKILILQMCHNGFYCCPGGHIHVGESSADAIVREMSEETGIKIKPSKLISIIENFFYGRDNMKVHEISFYYLLEPLSDNFSKEDFNLTENDEGVLKDLEFRWVDLDKLEEVNFKPQVLKDKLINRDFNFEHIIFDQTK